MQPRGIHTSNACRNTRRNSLRRVARPSRATKERTADPKAEGSRQVMDHGGPPAGAAASSLDWPLVNEEGERSFLCRGEFGRASRGLLAGGTLEAIAILWSSMTARRVQKIFFLQEVYTSYLTGHS